MVSFRHRRRSHRATVEDAIRILGHNRVCTYAQTREAFQYSDPNFEEPPFSCSIERLQAVAGENISRRSEAEKWRIFCDPGLSIMWLVGRFGYRADHQPHFCEITRRWLEPADEEQPGWIAEKAKPRYYLTNFGLLFRRKTLDAAKKLVLKKSGRPLIASERMVINGCFAFCRVHNEFLLGRDQHQGEHGCVGYFDRRGMIVTGGRPIYCRKDTGVVVYFDLSRRPVRQLPET